MCCIPRTVVEKHIFHDLTNVQRTTAQDGPKTAQIKPKAIPRQTEDVGSWYPRLQIQYYIGIELSIYTLCNKKEEILMKWNTPETWNISRKSASWCKILIIHWNQMC